MSQQAIEVDEVAQTAVELAVLKQVCGAVQHHVVGSENPQTLAVTDVEDLMSSRGSG